MRANPLNEAGAVGKNVSDLTPESYAKTFGVSLKQAKQDLAQGHSPARLVSPLKLP